MTFLYTFSSSVCFTLRRITNRSLFSFAHFVYSDRGRSSLCLGVRRAILVRMGKLNEACPGNGGGRNERNEECRLGSVHARNCRQFCCSWLCRVQTPSD